MQSDGSVKAGIVVAGGQGVRMGFKKQHALLAGVPMWLRSTEVLFAGAMDFVYVVVPSDDLETVDSQIREAKLQQRCFAVSGGASRSESVWNGLQALVRHLDARSGQAAVGFSNPGPIAVPMESLPRMEEVTVLVHDAARPFVSLGDVCSVARKAEVTGAAILAHPCKDTVKLVGSDVIQETISRDRLWLAETPQAFRLSLLYEAYQRLDNLESPTDDAAVMESAGYFVSVVPSTSTNMKITTPMDMEFALWYAEKLWGNGNGRGNPVDTGGNGI